MPLVRTIGQGGSNKNTGRSSNREGDEYLEPQLDGAIATGTW
jgi:hypothetical protein